MNRVIIRYKRAKNIIGKRYNRLVVLEQNGWKELTNNRTAIWKCLCDCGNIVDVPLTYLNVESTGSCGCLQKEVAARNGRANFKGDEISGFNKIKGEYKKRAKLKNMDFDLTDEQIRILFTDKCYYCEAEPKQISRVNAIEQRGLFLYNGIDRVDNTKGYTLENSVSCCKYCNTAKHDLTVEQFINHMKLILKTLESK